MESSAAYPPPPWRMHGQMWLTLVRTTADAGPERPAGVYGVGLVDYQEPSPLTYGELLVARQVTIPRPESGRSPTSGKHVTVTDIWVDSAPSRAGGRELWGVPKELADFTWDRPDPCRCPRSAVVRAGSAEIARVELAAPKMLLPRIPFRGSTWQRRDDGSPVVARLRGSARTFPIRARWDFPADGPLGWLRGSRQLATVAMDGFRMEFA